MSKFLHKASVIKWRNKTRISCACGWLSPIAPVAKSEQVEELTRLYIKHTGLIEVQKKVKTEE